MVSADAGSRAGKVVPYKPLLDEAIRLARHQPAKVLLVDRGLAPMERQSGRDVDYAPLRERTSPPRWRAPGSNRRRRATRSTPRHHRLAQGRAARHRRLCGGARGEHEAHLLRQGRRDLFSTSDIGWVVGHSYIVYGPLIAGMATILYEGLPIRPDAGTWWRLVEKYQVTAMFSAPTAIRVLKKQDPKYLHAYDLSSLRALFLAGEPLDESTSSWIAEALGKPIIDNYWQTESGWPILTVANGVEPMKSKLGSPGVPMYGYDVRLVDEATGRDIETPDTKGVVVIAGPTAPGFMQTVWHDDARFVRTYWESIPGRRVYSDVRLGHPRRRRLLLHPRTHRRRHQRRRAPPRHA